MVGANRPIDKNKKKDKKMENLEQRIKLNPNTALWEIRIDHFFCITKKVKKQDLALYCVLFL